MCCELHEIMEAIEGSKSILNKLVSSCEEDLSNEETLRVSRELDKLLNIYNLVAQDRTESSQEGIDFFMDEDSF